jgi:hypothetical protein
MIRSRIRPSRFALAAGLAVTTAVGTGAFVSVAASASAAAATDTVTAIPHLTGSGTAVTLDTATMAALKSLGVSVAPEGTATLVDNGTAVNFPITSGYAEIHSDKSFKPGYVIGSIEHYGSGLTLSAGSTSVTVSDFVIDPGNSMLYATLGSTPDVPLFFLNGSGLKITESGGAVHLDGTKVELTPTATTALDNAFHTTALKPYTEIGVAHITAEGKANTYTDKTTEISRLSGTSTSVQFNATTLKALTSLGITPSASGSATLISSGEISFPITGGVAVVHSDKSYKPGYIAGVLLHQESGLTLTKGSTVVNLSDFTVDPGDSMVQGSVNNGADTTDLFIANGSKVTVSSVGGTVHLDGTQLELTAGAASALNSAFGTTAFTPGFDLGTVHIIVSGS